MFQLLPVTVNWSVVTKSSYSSGNIRYF